MFHFSSYGFLSALDKGIKQDLFSYKCLSDILPITPYGLLRNVSFWLFIISYWFLAGHQSTRKWSHNTMGAGVKVVCMGFGMNSTDIHKPEASWVRRTKTESTRLEQLSRTGTSMCRHSLCHLWLSLEMLFRGRESCWKSNSLCGANALQGFQKSSLWGLINLGNQSGQLSRTGTYHYLHGWMLIAPLSPSA